MAGQAHPEAVAGAGASWEMEYLGICLTIRLVEFLSGNYLMPQFFWEYGYYFLCVGVPETERVPESTS